MRSLALLLVVLVLPGAAARSMMVCDAPIAQGCRVPDVPDLPRLPRPPTVPTLPEPPEPPPTNVRDLCRFTPFPTPEEPLSIVRDRVEQVTPEPIDRMVDDAFEDAYGLRERCRALLA